MIKATDSEPQSVCSNAGRHSEAKQTAHRDYELVTGCCGYELVGSSVGEGLELDVRT